MFLFGRRARPHVDPDADLRQGVFDSRVVGVGVALGNVGAGTATWGRVPEAAHDVVAHVANLRL